jgi:hypothetical protein
MKFTLKTALLTPFFCFFAVFLHGQEFEAKILLENAHLGELLFGCQAGATAGYDRGKDIFCPPGGIGDTGLVWFAAPQADLPSLYKDIKGCEFPQRWELQVQPPQRKKLILKWEPQKLPGELEFQLTGNGVDLDMKKVAELTVTAKGTLLISVRKNQPETTIETK